jgi:hypothetical protein
MKKMLGTHHGEDISEAILPVLEEYKIGPNLGVFVADNADSNDTAIRAMLQVLRPDLNIEDCRSRFLGHILNLAAKAFLFGKETSAFEDVVDLVNENDEAVESDKMKKAQDLWRKKGPVGRFHNIVVFIRSSPQRREAFRRCLVDESNKDLMVMLDNSTRWNSTYSSIKRGLELKERLMLFCHLRKAEISEDILSEADWHHLEEISIALEPFYEATLMSEGRADQLRHYRLVCFPREGLSAVRPSVQHLLPIIHRQRLQGGSSTNLAPPTLPPHRPFYLVPDKCHHLRQPQILKEIFQQFADPAGSRHTPPPQLLEPDVRVTTDPHRGPVMIRQRRHMHQDRSSFRILRPLADVQLTPGRLEVE